MREQEQWGMIALCTYTPIGHHVHTQTTRDNQAKHPLTCGYTHLRRSEPTP